MYVANLGRVVATKIDTAAGSTVALVPASAGKRVYVVAIALTLASQTTIKFQDGTTDLTGALTCTSFVLDQMNVGDRLIPRWTTSAGNAFNIVFGAAVQCSGAIWIIQD